MTTFKGTLLDIDLTSNILPANTPDIADPIQNMLIMSEKPVKVSNKTANEEAVYTFTFTTSIDIKVTDEIWIQFPRDFDAFVGDAEVTYRWSE